MSKNCHRARKFQGLYVFNTKSSPARWVKGGGEGEGGAGAGAGAVGVGVGVGVGVVVAVYCSVL